MKIVKVIFILIALAITISVQAQDSLPPQHATPIPFEIVFTGEGWTSQFILDKKFTGSKDLGIFALSYLRANYDNDEVLRESLNLLLLKYDLYKGFSLTSGAAYFSHWGFRPYVGGQYSFVSKNFMAAVITGYYLTESHNYEAIGMLEYRPALSDKWSLYTRVQGLYNQNTVVGKHDRSHTYVRLGLSYKSFSFGGAYNYDCYGPVKFKDQQWGIFISTLLF